MTYLAPLPLPTPMPPYGPHIGELNDVYMDFGLGSPQVFSWQVILGGHSASLSLSPFCSHLSQAFWGYFWDGLEAIWDSMVDV
jgi:hypothetical protein